MIKIGLGYFGNDKITKTAKLSHRITQSFWHDYKHSNLNLKTPMEIHLVKLDVGKDYGKHKRFNTLSEMDYIYITHKDYSSLDSDLQTRFKFETYVLNKPTDLDLNDLGCFRSINNYILAQILYDINNKPTKVYYRISTKDIDVGDLDKVEKIRVREYLDNHIINSYTYITSPSIDNLYNDILRYINNKEESNKKFIKMYENNITKLMDVNNNLEQIKSDLNLKKKKHTIY